MTALRDDDLPIEYASKVLIAEDTIGPIISAACHAVVGGYLGYIYALECFLSFPFSLSSYSAGCSL